MYKKTCYSDHFGVKTSPFLTQMHTCVFGPDVVLKSIHNLVNQVREQYNKQKLVLDDQLSFLAGEHACKMSTRSIQVGHDGYDERFASVPTALAFSENVGEIPKSDEPGNDMLMYWITRNSSFSRILSDFTHTGIGASESDDGHWYCCQIFATFKEKPTAKEALLIAMRNVNKYRIQNGISPLAVSLTATHRLMQLARNSPEAFQGMTLTRAKQIFNDCESAEYIAERVPAEGDPLKTFLADIKEHSNYRRAMRNDEYTDIAFFMKKFTKNEMYNCVLILGKCDPLYRPVPLIDVHYPHASRSLQIVNDYRESHQKGLFKISHRWCRFADLYAKKMMLHDCEFDAQKIHRRMIKCQPKIKVNIGSYFIPMSSDPIRELFLMWISSNNSKSVLLSDNTIYGFGISILNDKYIYAIRIIGNQSDDTSISKDHPSYDQKTIQYLQLTSDEEEL